MEIEIYDLDGKFEKDGNFVDGKLVKCEFQSEYLDDELFKEEVHWVHIYNTVTIIKEDVGVVYWVVLDCDYEDKIRKTMEKFVFKGLDSCVAHIIRGYVEEIVSDESNYDLIYSCVCNHFQNYGKFDIDELKRDIIDLDF